MFRFMKLELRRNNMKTYYFATLATFLLVVGFTYLFAYVPKLNPEDADLLLFAGYDNVITLSTLICMAIFCVLSSVMYSRFVIDEYAGKQATLLFSYPVDRRKILLAKLLVVFIYIFIAMVICNLLSLGIFGITEKIEPMVSDTMTTDIIAKAIRGTIIMGFTAASLGVVATGVGFIKKSVPTTIVSSVVMVAVLGNIMSGALTNVGFLYVLLGISALTAIIVTTILMGKVKAMEIE